MRAVASDHELMAEAIAALRRSFAACREELNRGRRATNADAVAAAIAAHLGEVKMADLPVAAQTIWHDRILRPLKADARKPLPARAIAAVRSWPSQRIDDLLGALAGIEAILTDAENDARNEIIYAEISRAYS